MENIFSSSLKKTPLTRETETKKAEQLQSFWPIPVCRTKVDILGFRIACLAGMSQTIEAIGSYNWSYFDSCHSTKTYYSCVVTNKICK